jgi:hypothetical protein
MEEGAVVVGGLTVRPGATISPRLVVTHDV